MGGQAHVEEEGLETEVDTDARVVPVEQENRENPEMKILSSFTQPRVVLNLYEFLCSPQYTIR